MLSLIGTLLGSVFGIGKDYLEHKQEIQKIERQGELDLAKTKAETDVIVAKAQAEIDVSHATNNDTIEQEQVRQMDHSWKDEYWTIIISLPFLIVWLPFDWSIKASSRFFHVLDMAPSWYTWTAGALICASVGIRTIPKVFGK